MWPRLKRWLYDGGRPGLWARAINRGVAALHAAGVGPASWITLEVVGRKTGRSIAFPLVMVSQGGRRFLVSMLGANAAWVRNLEAAGGAAVLRHDGAEAVRLAPLEPAARGPVLRAYLRAAPGARPHLPVSRNAPLAAFDAIARDFPVFEVLPAA